MSVWWYEFVFRGVRIRETSNSPNKSVCERLQRERRRSMELGSAGLQETKQPELFGIAVKKWFEVSKPHWSESNVRIEGYNVAHLTPHFGKMLLSDITADDISRYQGARRKALASPRTVNMEVGTLRAVLRKHRLWAQLQPDVRMLKARGEIGRSLTADERHRLLVACKKSRSRSLYPAVQLSLHSGLRSGELKSLKWRQIDLLERTLTVGKSKTTGGDGRIIPLSMTATKCLQEWRMPFPDAQPGHYVFPSERYGLAGEDGYAAGKVVPYDIKPDTPIGSWKTGWNVARKAAKVSCRWHDMRHTFVSKMAEGQASDATIMSLAGHLSRKMMERYSHTRNEAKREAISALDREYPQNPPQ